VQNYFDFLENIHIENIYLQKIQMNGQKMGLKWSDLWISTSHRLFIYKNSKIFESTPGWII